MKITKRQLKRIIKEEQAKLLKEYNHQQPGEEIPAAFTNSCMEDLDMLIDEGNQMGISFPIIIQHIKQCLDRLAEGGL